MRTEAFPALHQDEEGVQAHGKDGPVGIRPVLEREQMLQTLGPDGTPETQRSQTDTDPTQSLTGIQELGFERTIGWTVFPTHNDHRYIQSLLAGVVKIQVCCDI